MQSLILINLKSISLNLLNPRCLNRFLTSSTRIYKTNMIDKRYELIKPKLSLYTVVSRNATSSQTNSTQNVIPKKQSKFKQFYSQYGPLFIVVHLTTVVMWIYGFFLISKQ